MKKLGELTQIRMGATLRGRDATRPVPHGSCFFIRIGDISQAGELVTNELTRIEPNEPIHDDLFLKPGDVLFPNRGVRTTALVYRLGLSRALVGSQFFVMRPAEALLPEYLAWFLRTEEAARYFEGRRKGTYVKIIQRGDLTDLDVPLPPMTVQRMIVEAAGLALRERVISEQLADRKWRHTQNRLVEAARTHSEKQT